MSINQFFEGTLGANLANVRWSWGATNAATNQVFLRVWEDHLTSVDGVDCIILLRDRWKGISAGFSERLQHIDYLQGGAEGFGVLCRAKDVSTTGTRAIRSFDRQRLLRFGRVFERGAEVYAEIVARVPIEDLKRPRSGLSTLVPDLRSIFNRRKLEATTKERLANARLGQGLFRAQVLSIWGGRCCLTGARTKEAIRASHIKPWRDASEKERLDPYNGLPIVATFDALFDAGLISFSDDGAMMVSKRLGVRERHALGISTHRLSRKPHELTCAYLAYHRNEIFVES